MSAIKNLIEKGWDDKKITGSDLRAAEKELNKLLEILAPFAHPDLSRQLGGNVEGDESIVFVRGDAELKLMDFRKAAQVIVTATE